MDVSILSQYQPPPVSLYKLWMQFWWYIFPGRRSQYKHPSSPTASFAITGKIWSVVFEREIKEISILTCTWKLFLIRWVQFIKNIFVNYKLSYGFTSNKVGKQKGIRVYVSQCQTYKDFEIKSCSYILFWNLINSQVYSVT